MKKLNFKKLFCIIFSALMLCQGFALCTFAEESEGEVIEMLQWTASIDGNTISDGTRTFKFYCSGGTYGNTEIIEASAEIFHYENPVEITDPDTGLTRCNIYSKTKDFPIIWLTFSYETRYYATEEGARLLDAFFNRENCIYRLYGDYTAPDEEYSENRYFTIGEELVQKMNSMVATEEMDVRALVSVPNYYLRYYDSTDTFYLKQGILFALPDGYYYANFENLENYHFDASGNFSFRKGTVFLAKLDSETASGIAYALETPDEWRESKYTYERDLNNTDSELPPIIFWFFYVIFVLVLPVPGLVVGLILPHIKKLGKPKYWYSLSIIHGLWILFGLILAIVLLI